MKKVTKDEFYKAIGPLDVFMRIVNDKHPYKREFRLKNSYCLVGIHDRDGSCYLDESRLAGKG